MKDHFGDLNHFFAAIPTSAENVPDVRKAMAGVIDSFSSRLISRDELERARRPILKLKPLGTSSPRYWVNTLKLASRQPDLIDDLGKEKVTLEETTLEDLRKLAARIISYGACEFTVISGK